MPAKMGPDHPREVALGSLQRGLGASRMAQLRALARDTKPGLIYLSEMSLPAKDPFGRAMVAVPADELLALLDAVEALER